MVIEKLINTDKIKSVFLEDHDNMVFVKIIAVGLMGNFFFQSYYSKHMIFCKPESVDAVYEVVIKDLETAENTLLQKAKGADV